MTASSRLHNAPALPADLPLIVRGLRVGRGQKVLLDDMNWQIAAGQAILITGPNGTGKTSLLRTIAGFIPPMSGEILLGDSRFAPHQPDSPLRLSYYGMADGLAELMTGRDALLQYVKFRRRGRTDPVNPEIDSPEIDKFSCAPFLDTEIRHLSGGQRQRLALSRLALDLAATEERYLWLLDEPDSALDIEGRQVLEEMISDMLASGGRVIMTSHQPPDMQFAHRVLELNNTRQARP